jgi:hypothetical protein
MGKVFNSMILGIVITVALALFNGSGIAPTSLVIMLLNPTGWETSNFWLSFSALFTVSGAIVIGLAAIIKQDWVVRAGMISALSSIVIFPFVDLFTFMNSHLGYIAEASCINSPVCSQLNSVGGVGQFIAIIVAGPLLLYALWASIEWIFSGDKF